MFRQFPGHKFSNCCRTKLSVHADVFVPNFGMVGNVLREHLGAFVRMGVEDFGAVLAEPVDTAAKINGLADDHRADALPLSACRHCRKCKA